MVKPFTRQVIQAMAAWWCCKCLCTDSLTFVPSKETNEPKHCPSTGEYRPVKKNGLAASCHAQEFSMNLTQDVFSESERHRSHFLRVYGYGNVINGDEW